MSDNKMITIKDYMSAPAVQSKMQEMLIEPAMIRQFTTSVISIAGSDALLATAEPRSLFNACLTAASLNLPINKNLGFAHIIGYKNNKKGGIVEAQFQLGAKGLKQLAQRTGQYVFLNDSDVREGEVRSRDRMTGAVVFDWVEDDAIRNDLPIIGYLSYFELKSGFKSTLYMTVEQIKAHGKKYSQSYKAGFGPWVDNFEAMALKTVTKLNLNKNGPISTELQKAVEVDQAVIADDGKVNYIDGDELANVTATDDEMDSIISSQVPEGVDPETGEIVEGQQTSFDSGVKPSGNNSRRTTGKRDLA